MSPELLARTQDLLLPLSPPPFFHAYLPSRLVNNQVLDNAKAQVLICLDDVIACDRILRHHLDDDGRNPSGPRVIAFWWGRQVDRQIRMCLRLEVSYEHFALASSGDGDTAHFAAVLPGNKLISDRTDLCQMIGWRNGRHVDASAM